MNQRRFVAVIPAKGYSGRVPEKNFRPFADGRSLLELKIEHCLGSGVFDAVYVSSDDARAKALADRLGAAFAPRDARYCQDATPWGDVLEGVLAALPEDDAAWVAWCPVTSPLFRRYGEALAMLQAQAAEGINSVVTTTPLRHYFLDSNHLPLNHQWGVWAKYSQGILPIYQLNMACNVTTKAEMLRNRMHIGSNPAFFETEAWEGVDIDTLEEFELAQWYYQKRFGTSA